jgi:voltage-gated potassium channel
MVARVPLFAALDAGSISEVMKIMRTRMVPPGTVLAAKGEEAEGMYFIADGEIQIRLRHRTITLGPGDFFGEVALIKKVERMGTVRAVTRANLMMIDSADFESLLLRNAELRERITAVADERMAEWVDVTGDVLEEEMALNREEPRPLGDPIA